MSHMTHYLFLAFCFYSRTETIAMARKARRTQDSLSDDDAPEVVPHSTSKAEAKRNQKALHDFEAEEKARRKARNRERDEKLKERARMAKGKKTDEKPRGVRFMDQELEGEDDGNGGEDVNRDEDEDDVEARMLRAMRDAADEMGSSEGEDDDDDDDGEFRGFGQGMDLGDDMASGSDSSFAHNEDDDDAEMSPGESDSIDPEALTDDEEMDEDEEEEETTPLQANIHKSSRKADYLADDLFAAAFASQNSKQPLEKNIESTQRQTIRKRRRKSIARPKDLVIGYVMSSQVQFVRHSFQVVQWSYHPHVTPTLRSTIASHCTKCPVCTRSQICGPKLGYEGQASTSQGQEKRLGKTTR